MASEPVRSTTVVIAPKDYSVAGGQQIRLLSVRASFDGTGSAAAWLPALQILDNNGNILSSAALQSVSVAAGGSADVDWFPGVTPQAAASSASAEWAWASAVPGTSFGAGNHDIIWSATSFKTSNTSVFSLGNHSGANTAVQVAQAGIVLTFCTAQPPVADWAHGIFTGGTNENEFGAGNLNYVSDSGGFATPNGNTNYLTTSRFSVGFGVPFKVFVTVANYTAVGHTLAFAEIGCIWLPNSTFFS